jgi:Fe2+ transport system protein B
MTIRVLVFGATGTGKTSLCNTITGRKRRTDNGARGVTEKSHLFGSFVHDGTAIELVDTAGLHESCHGTVPAEKAVLQLVELLERSRNGYNLLVHVARASRITREQEEDFEFFVTKMTQSCIPVILAVTGCENESPMTAWAERNRSAFERFEYAEIVSTCFAGGGTLEEYYSPLRAQSRQALLEAIVKHALSTPYILYGQDSGVSFSDALSRLWNDFVDWAELPSKYRKKVNESAYSLMKRIGVPDDIAKAAIQHVPDLIEELASKAPLPGSGKIARFIAEVLIKKIFKKSGQNPPK